MERGASAAALLPAPADGALALIDEVASRPRREPSQFSSRSGRLIPANRASKREPGGAELAGGKIRFHPLEILGMEGPAGVEFQPQHYGSVLVGGSNPDKAVYTIRARTTLTNIRGFRLEALTDHGLPNHGPGGTAPAGPAAISMSLGSPCRRPPVRSSFVRRRSIL